MNKIVAITKNPVNIFWVVLTAVFLFYYRSLLDFFSLWVSTNNPTYNHGLLLFVVCITLFVKKWNKVEGGMSLQPERAGYVLLVLSSLLWFLACLGNVQIFEHFAFIFVLAALVWALLGYVTAKHLVFPILLLLMATTVWDGFAVPLQYATAHAVNVGLNISGVPTLIEGIHLHIPEGVFHVAGGCSGLGQFIVAITIAMLYSNMTRLKITSGTVVVFLSALVAILSNAIRVYIVVVAGHLTNMQHALISDHYNLGWVIFGINIFVFLFLVGRYFLKSDATLSRSHPFHKSKKPTLKSVGFILISAMFAISVGPLLLSGYQSYLGAMPALTDELNANRILPESSKWQVIEDRRVFWHPVTKGSSLFQAKTYKSDNDEIVLYSRNVYRLQSPGKEAIQYGNAAYDEKMWYLLSRQNLKSDLYTGLGQGVKESRIRSVYGQEMLVWQWYDVMGLPINSDIVGKVLNVAGILIGSPDISYSAIATTLDSSDLASSSDNYSRARNSLRSFFSQL